MAGRTRVILAAGMMGGWGCSAGSADDDVGRRLDPIVNGSVDTTHQAVVAWLHGSKCTATIVDTNPATGEGWALTAAHCVNANLGNLRQGDDHANGQFDRQYPVAEVDVHPRYAISGAFDFAMIRFTGADASTPTLPVLSSAQDTISSGSPALLVGYGNVNGPAPTSLRHSVAVTADSASDTFIAWDQQNGLGGVCSGDSGGPALYDAAGQLRVAAVHSFITDSSCEAFGVSMRSSAVKDSFIDPFIAGQAYGLETCDVCVDAHRNFGLCVDDVQECQNSIACNNFLTCAQGCTNNACVVQCSIDHAAGRAQYDSIVDCYCDTACTSECAGDTLCAPAPTCYLPDPDPSCQTCLDGACCAAATDCATDPYCNSCFSSNNPALLCGGDEKVQAVVDCVANCDPSCDFGFSEGTSSSSSVAASTSAGVGGAGVTAGGGGTDSATTSAGAGGDNPVAGAPSPGAVDSGCAVHAPGGDPAPEGWLILGLLGLGVRRRRR